MEEIAKIWLRDKVTSEIIGTCCEISNECGHIYPFVYRKDGWGSKESIYLKLSKIAMLLHNFQDYINIDTVIDDYFERNSKLPREKQNHWCTPSHYKEFKSFVKEAKIIVRDSKISDILK
jgi:hypothetical protein